MKRIWAVFFRDLKNIVRNPVAVIVALGIMILPSLYAWFNIAANWDPYGNTRGLKVAVTSLDKGARIDALDTTVNIGDMIVSDLRANAQIGWQFVNEQTALEGVKSGNYYACVVIPRDFSEKLATVFTSDVEKPSLEYYVNEKKNAIATKITDKGVETIQQQVNASLISASSEALQKAWNASLGAAREDGSDAAAALLSSLKDARTDLELMGSSSETLKSALTAGKTLLNGVQALLPDSGGLLKSGMAAGEDAKRLILSSKQLSGVVTDSVGNVLDIGGQLMDSADDSIQAAAGKWSQDAGEAAKALEQASDGLSAMAAINGRLLDTVNGLKGKLPAADTALGAFSGLLSAQIEREKNVIHTLEAQVDQILKTGEFPEEERKALRRSMAEAADQEGRITNQYRNQVKPVLAAELDGLYDTISAAADQAAGVNAILPQLDTAMTDTGNSFDSFIKMLDQAGSMISAGEKKLDQIILRIESVSKSRRLAEILEIMKNDPETMGSFLSAPVQLNENQLYPIANYGSAMTPFYTILAIWVGGLVLVAVLKCRVSEDEKLIGLKPYEKYFGRYLIFMVFGMLQALIVALGDLYLLNIQCGEPFLFVAAALMASVVFVNIIYTLTISFGDVGKALAVILLVIQVAGAGGTFPIEVTPHFFRLVNPLLPFTHAINAMRECVGGIYGSAYRDDMVKIMLYLPISLFVGIVLRKQVLRLHDFFERKLEETGIM